MSIAELKAAASGEAVRLYEEREVLGDRGPIWYREFPRWPRRMGFYVAPDGDLEAAKRDPTWRIAVRLLHREPTALTNVMGRPYVIVDCAHHLDLYDELADLEHQEAMHEAYEFGVEDYHFPDVRLGDRFCLLGFRAVMTRWAPGGKMGLALIDEEGEQMGGTTIVDCVVKPLPRDVEVYVEPIRGLPKSAVGRKHLIKDLAAIIENGLA